MSIRILLVDDNEEKIELLRREIISYGVTPEDIFVVLDASHARKILDSKNFDLLLLDLILPARADDEAKADVGLELLRQIAEDHDLPGPQNIVGITADVDALKGCEDNFRKLTTDILYVTPESADWKFSLRNLIRRLISAKAKRFSHDVCFFTALRAPEQEAVLELPIEWAHGEELLGNGILFRKGQFIVNGIARTVVSAHANQMGLVSASFTSRLLIEHFAPELLLMPGICGGIDGKAKLGDVVIAERSWDWQSGKWLHDGTFEIAPDQKEGCSELIALAQRAQTNLQNYHAEFSGARPGTTPGLLVGPMVSGSAVVADAKMHERFTIQHRKSIAIDMECYGMYFVAAMSPEPRPKALCIKAISDLASREKSNDIQAYCSSVSAKLAFDVFVSYFQRK